MAIKVELLKLCFDFVEHRYQTITDSIREIQESLASETKSSAGDKHETGRAMLQLEREKAGQQLAEIQKLQQVISKIDTTKSASRIGLGSIVFTSQSNYFIAISAGEAIIDNTKFYAISASTPIAQLLLSKQAGDLVSFRNHEFKITNVE